MSGCLKVDGLKSRNKEETLNVVTKTLRILFESEISDLPLKVYRICVKNVNCLQIKYTCF